MMQLTRAALGHINQTKGYPGAESNIPPLTWKDDPGVVIY